MRVCLTTLGSFGDLHPMLGLAHALKKRGHLPVLATSPAYREIIEGEGIAFHGIRPDIQPNDREVIRRVMDRTRGTEALFEMIMPHFRDSYEDLLVASEGADVLVTHPITFAGPVIAAQRGMPWVSTVLAPMSFFSVHDFPVLPPAPGVVHLTERSPTVARVIGRGVRAATRSWMKPVYDLRAELGFAPGAHPIFEGQHSPLLVLALFSRVLGDYQPDWPPNVCITGAVRYDAPAAGDAMTPELEAFLDSGPPPVVFTLGSAAVGAAGSFYEESAGAAIALGRRAVLVVGRYEENRPRRRLPDGVLVTEYAPYSQLLPRAAAVVHQGGAGTTHQALAAGHPELIVPFSHDQPDNAHRVERLGIAKVIYPNAYRAD
ncbi:MAG TPA: glycosyltransferase, partial [Gemmatimonadaceae bacterium]|nr:glycosyltransferase [Gemmatimonadaceae bacterium]